MKVNKMGNQLVEARFKIFSVNMTDYASTEQRIRKGLPILLLLSLGPKA